MKKLLLLLFLIPNLVMADDFDMKNGLHCFEVNPNIQITIINCNKSTVNPCEKNPENCTNLDGGTASTADDVLIPKYTDCAHACPESSSESLYDAFGDKKCNDPTWIALYCASGDDADGDATIFDRCNAAGQLPQASASVPTGVACI
jgi:hypothetical protein